MEYIGTKYPKECCSVVRDKTLAITPELFLAKAAEGNPPARIYNSFSRFAFALINENKKPVTANVSLEEFENIRVLSRIAQDTDVKSRIYSPVLSKFDRLCILFEKMYDEIKKAFQRVFSILSGKKQKEDPSAGQDQKKAEKALKLAGGVRIANGNLKGKTPLEVLNGITDGEQALLNQKKWLETNLDRYPANKQQIEAINAALYLKRTGQLQENGATSTSGDSPQKVVTIFSAEYRPLIRKQREDGKCPVYHIVIRWNLGQDYPVSVRITNYYAPVKKNENGLLNVQASEATDRIDTEMCLSASEWNNALRSMAASMHQFETYYSKICILDAEDADKRNRVKAVPN